VVDVLSGVGKSFGVEVEGLWAYRRYCGCHSRRGAPRSSRCGGSRSLGSLRRRRGGI